MFDFPNNPSVGQTFTSGGSSYIWNGYAWSQAATGGPIGDTGGELTDGDKLDIIVTNNGLTWTIDPTVATTAGRALIDDADAAAQRVTLGLGNVDNTSDLNKPISTATAAALAAAMPRFATLAAVQSANLATINYIYVDNHSAPDDGGSAFYKKVGAQPAHVGRVQSSDGSWFELAREQVLSPCQVGAKFDGVTNDTQAHKNFAGVLNIFKGGVVRFPHNRVSIIWPGTAPSIDVLYTLTGMRGLTVDFNGSAIRAVATAFVDSTYVFWLSDDNENVTFHNPRYEQPNLNSINVFIGNGTLRGANFIHTTGRLRGLLVTNLTQTGGTGGVGFARNAGSPEVAEGICLLNAVVTDTFYPTSFQKSGNNVLVRGWLIDNPGRTYIAYNIRDHDIAMTIFERGVVVPTCSLSVLTDHADQYTQNMTVNVKLNFDFRPRAPAQPGACYFIARWRKGTGVSTPGYVRGVKFRIIADYTTNTTLGLGIHFTKSAFGGAPDNVPRSNIFEDIEISGNIWVQNQATELIRFNGNAENGTGDTYRDIRFQDLNIINAGTGHQTVLIDGRGFTTPLLWDVRCDGKVQFRNFADGMVDYRPESTYGVDPAPRTWHALQSHPSGYSQRFAVGQVISANTADFVIPVKGLSDYATMITFIGGLDAFGVTNQFGSPLPLMTMTIVEGYQGFPRDKVVVRCTFNGVMEPGQATLLVSGLYGGSIRFGTVGTPNIPLGALRDLAEDLVEGLEEEVIEGELPEHHRFLDSGPEARGHLRRGDVVRLKNSPELPTTVMGFDDDGAVLNVPDLRRSFPVEELELVPDDG